MTGGEERAASSGPGMNRFQCAVLAVVAVAGTVLGGCQFLMPSGKTEVVSGWASFEEAEAVLATVEPYRTTRDEVHAAGLDPTTDSTVSILNFADILQRFSVSALADPNGFERGIQDCLRAGQRCAAYAVKAEKVRSKRVGNFWLDLLNFKRETESSGWNFNALVVFVDDLVVYRITGGQPRLHSYEVRRQPLGPLQNIGESLRPTIP